MGVTDGRAVREADSEAMIGMLLVVAWGIRSQ